MSQWDFCSPEQRFCTTWMASCKGSIGLEKNKSSVRASRVSLTRPQGVCGERKKKRLSVFHTMSSFWPGGSKTKEQRLETALRFFRNWTRQRMVNNHSRENRKWLVGSITWQLVNSLHQNLVNGNCSRLEEAGNSNEYNVCKKDSPVLLASLPCLTLRFQLLFDCSVPTWIRKITDCFAVYKRLGWKWFGTVIVLLTIVLNG